MSSNTSTLYGQKDLANAMSRDHTLIHKCFDPLHDVASGGCGGNRNNHTSPTELCHAVANQQPATMVATHVSFFPPKLFTNSYGRTAFLTCYD